MKNEGIHKIRFVFVLFLFTGIKVFGTGGYINLLFGYNLAAGSITLSEFYFNSNAQIVSGSLGKGLTAGTSFGYMFTENIGAELELTYLKGSEYQIKDEYSYFGYGEISETKMSGSMIRISPGIKLALDRKSVV